MTAMNILVVDDESVICSGCRMVLEEQGHHVETCMTCKAGIDAVKNNPYDLILLDMKLPDHDGTEFLKAVGQSDTRHRIIVMSGYATVKNAVNSMKLGAVDYLQKPFTDDELLAVVENAVRHFR